VKIGILEPKDFSIKATSVLVKIGKLYLFTSGTLNKFLFDKDILFTRLGILIDKEFLKSARSLKYICTPTTGLNHIDLNECEKRNIKIISLKGEYEFLSKIRATPEHTFGLVLSLLRNYKKAFMNCHNSMWDRDLYKGYELFENTVGIIGIGRVGRILVKYFEAFGANVYFYDKVKSKTVGKSAIKCDSIEHVIALSNIIILCASYSKIKPIIIDKKKIDLLEGKYFINTSRGELIDETYLIKKIKQNYFSGVAIDTIQNEQTENNFNELVNLAKYKNFIITPHIGGATYNSMKKTEEYIVNKLEKHIKKYNI